jgi:hypothetical protein
MASRTGRDLFSVVCRFRTTGLGRRTPLAQFFQEMQSIACRFGQYIPVSIAFCAMR